MKLENVVNDSPSTGRGKYTGRLETLHSTADNCSNSTPEDLQSRIDVVKKILQADVQCKTY